jgi:putative drug exporter of the RND superfamily
MRVHPESLARASSRHPWRVLVAWLVVVAAFGTAAGTLLAGALTSDIAFTNEPESVRAEGVIERTVTGPQRDTEFYVVRSTSLPVADPAFEAFVRRVKADVEALGKGVVAGPIATVYDLPQDRGAGLVSRDGRATLLPVPIANDETATVDRLRTVIERDREPGFEVLLAGPATLNADTSTVAEEDLRTAEGIGLLFAFIVLVVVFGALVAALLPLLIALFIAIPVALGGVALLGRAFDFSLFTPNMVTMIGLAVGIDYSLFIVARYREERRRGFDKYGAIGATGATASRAVLFSGLTVVVALVGMFILPTTIFRSMATGAILVVLASIAATLTLLPALLGLVGDGVNWPRVSRRAKAIGDPDPRGGFWDRVTRAVMRAPVVSLLISVAILGGLGAFYFQMTTGTSGVSTLPDDVPSKQAFEVLSREFAGGLTDPAEIIVVGDVGSPSVQGAIGRLRREIAADPAFADATTVRPGGDGDAALVSAFFAGDPQSTVAFDSIYRLRDTLVPRAFGGVSAQVLVGGQTAFFADFLRLSSTYQPIVFAFVLGLSFLLLMWVFRSLVVPLKAIVMNLLSVGAAYGAIVLVFQRGVGLEAFNALGFKFVRVDAIEAWLPLFLFSILFGLSMDYHVFLLSRIREHYDKTRDNGESVAYGLRTTAGIITGAALIMVVVFTAFAAGRLGALQQMGFGLAVAVLIDATIVRSVLVPATMKLLGDRNWYFPSWLEWLPRLNVEGHEPPMQYPETPELVRERASSSGVRG